MVETEGWGTQRWNILRSVSFSYKSINKGSSPCRHCCCRLLSICKCFFFFFIAQYDYCQAPRSTSIQWVLILILERRRRGENCRSGLSVWLCHENEIRSLTVGDLTRDSQATLWGCSNPGQGGALPLTAKPWCAVLCCSRTEPPARN